MHGKVDILKCILIGMTQIHVTCTVILPFLQSSTKDAQINNDKKKFISVNINQYSKTNKTRKN